MKKSIACSIKRSLAILFTRNICGVLVPETACGIPILRHDFIECKLPYYYRLWTVRTFKCIITWHQHGSACQRSQLLKRQYYENICLYNRWRKANDIQDGLCSITQITTHYCGISTILSYVNLSYYCFAYVRFVRWSSKAAFLCDRQAWISFLFTL